MAQYRVEELARLAGTSVRNVRAYRDRRLLPAPRRAGQVTYYSDDHLDRLRLIARLNERGYSLASIADLLAAWERGAGLGEVLGVDGAGGGAAVGAGAGAGADGGPEVILSRQELADRLGQSLSDAQLARLVELEVLAVLAVQPDGYDRLVVRRPRLLQVGADLVAAGVPLDDVLRLAAWLRARMGEVADELVRVFTEHLVDPLGAVPTAEEVADLARTLAKLRPAAAGVVLDELSAALDRDVEAEIAARLARLSGGEPSRRRPARR